MEESINDAVLILNETKELKDLANLNDEKKSDIILRAARKLEDKYDDHSVIAAKLKRAWKDINISPTYIRAILPEQYHRPYTTPADRQKIKPTDMEKFCMDIKSLLNNASKLWGQFATRLHDDYVHGRAETIIYDQNAMRQDAETASEELIGQIEKIIDTKSLNGLTKELNHDYNAIRSLLDERQKFSVSWKLTIKLLLLWRSFDGVAKLLVNSKKHGAKWLSKIDHDPELEDFFRHAGHCPKCNWDWTRYMEKAHIAQKHLRKVPKL